MQSHCFVAAWQGRRYHVTHVRWEPIRQVIKFVYANIVHTIEEEFRLGILHPPPPPSPSNKLTSLYSTLETQSLVEGISSSLVLGAQTGNKVLRIRASRLRSVVGTAHVDELVADKVGDDVGVEGIALAAVGDEGVVRGEEGALGGLAVELGTAELEVNGGCAVAKVGVGEGGGCLGRDGGDEGGNDGVVLHFEYVF